MSINVEDFNKLNFKFDNIYRGLVENNVDPLDVGRVQVRIYGFHSFDGNECPIEQLPWAMPALGLAWSGGYNNYNEDYGPDTGPNTKLNGRYNVGPNSKVLGTDQTVSEYPVINDNEFHEIDVDPVINACGTGGQWVIPKRGNQVFLFFEGGNHETPVYFAMAPMARDWNTTKNWRNAEINSKTSQITKFKEEFLPRDKSQAKNNSWASKAIVNPLVNKPNLKIINPVIDGEPDTTNRDIQCMTSAQGTTIVIDQRKDREQIFVIHKNFMEYTDIYGNRKIYVGKKRNVDTIATQNDIEDPCHYEMGVEGNHELHVLGNYDLYSKGRIHIQCDSHAQIDVKNSAGIVVREGDIDLIVEKGNINADIAGNLDADVGKHLNAKINENANILVNGSLKSTVNGTSDLYLKDEVKLNTDGDLNITANNIKMKANNIDLNATNVRVSNNIHIGGATRISGTIDVGNTAKFASSLYVNNNISCGGSLSNRGRADLGSPLIAHGLSVVGGTGSGSGRGATAPDNPDEPINADEASKENGIDVEKTYSNNENGDPNPIQESEINP